MEEIGAGNPELEFADYLIALLESKFE